MPETNLEAPSIELEKLINEYKSTSALESDVKRWFYKIYVKGQNTKSLSERYYQMGLKYFSPIKFYFFGYNHKKPLKNEFYDKFPLVLSLEQRLSENQNTVKEFGINFHFIPRKQRIIILDRIYNRFKYQIQYNELLIEQGKPQSQKPIKIDYDEIKKLLAGTGFEFATRSYIHSNFLTNPEIITYKDWAKVSMLESQQIKGKSLAQIFQKYQANRRS
jgi:hypothetical protein